MLQVFRKLDSIKSGRLSGEIIEKFHSPLEQDFQNTVGRRQSISYAVSPPITIPYTVHVCNMLYISQDFEHYYHGLSIETTKDPDFITLMNNYWSI